MKRYILGINRTYDIFKRADIVTDNTINILDFIQLQRTIIGTNRKTYGNSQNDGVTWIILDDIAGVPSIYTLGYRIHNTCYVTLEEPSRIVYDVKGFAYADKNPNPEIAYPDITVGTITINQQPIDTNSASGMLVFSGWLWDYRVGYPNNLFAKQNSEFKCIISCMHKDAIYPLNTIENTFVF